MKSVKNDSGIVEESAFPKLMRHSSYGTIWLMTSRRKGTAICIGKGSAVALGHWRDSVDHGGLEDYNGSITLSN